MAFEVKCGSREYLYSQKDHMIFQAEGHKQTTRNALFAHERHPMICQKKKTERTARCPARSWLADGGNVAKEK